MTERFDFNEALKAIQSGRSRSDSTYAAIAEALPQEQVPSTQGRAGPWPRPSAQRPWRRRRR